MLPLKCVDVVFELRGELNAPNEMRSDLNVYKPPSQSLRGALYIYIYYFLYMCVWQKAFAYRVPYYIM